MNASPGRSGFGRPLPTVIHDGLVVPGDRCGELAAALDLLEAFVNGTAPPASVRAPRMSRTAEMIRTAARDAAVEHRQQLNRQAAANAQTPSFLSPAQTAPLSAEEMVTTEQAATVTGLTEQRIRQLAADGTIRGTKSDRNVWHLDRASVEAYRTRGASNAATDTRRQAHRSAA